MLLQRTNLGRIEVEKEVVAAIAGAAAAECYGVISLAGHNLQDLAGMWKREHAGKGVAVSGDGQTLQLDVQIVVAYGTRVSAVAENVRERVSYAVENATGARVQRVNVAVQGLRVGREGGR